MSASRVATILFADDLTGANDAGAQIAKRGLTTTTVFDPALACLVQSEGIVIDTESRSLPVEQARAAVREAARTAIRLHADILYKKVDSTLRGHIGAELRVLVEELAPQLVICAPAYPKNGRTTRDGIHRVADIPLAETEFAHDPSSPIAISELPAILMRERGLEFHHVMLSVLRSSAAARVVASERYLSFDCVDQRDLRRIVDLGRSSRRRILWCGSAGLAEVLLSVRDWGPIGTRPGLAARDGVAALPLLAVAGSASQVTRSQVTVAAASPKTASVLLDPNAAREAPEGEAARLTEELERKAGSAHSSTPAPRYLLLAVRSELAAGDQGSAGEPHKGMSAVISRSLAAAAGAYIRRNRIAGLVLIGGETAYETCRAAGVTGMRIVGELEAGVAIVRFIGGELENVAGVTKAGGFGDAQSLIRSLDYLGAR